MPAQREKEVAGLAHVATVSFLASRAIPSIGFWVALGGGVAVARAAARRGPRWGYGASIAAMLQTVALIGPARIGVPLTQALTAPLIGVLEARGATVAWQMFVCGTIRLFQNALTGAFVILVLTGGFDVYVETYDSIAGWMPLLPEGETAAIVAILVALVGWAVFASVVQVLVYRRGLHAWPTEDPLHVHLEDGPAAEPRRGRFDPRAVVLSAVIAFTVLLASISWGVLAAVAAWLVVAALTCRGDREVVPTGLLLAGALALAVFLATMLGGLGFEEALARATRASLLVLVATWLRAAAGAGGLREVSRRGLGRLRRLPSAPRGGARHGRSRDGAPARVRGAVGPGRAADGRAPADPGPRRRARVGRRGVAPLPSRRAGTSAAPARPPRGRRARGAGGRPRAPRCSPSGCARSSSGAAAPILFSPMWMWLKCAMVGSRWCRRFPRFE